MNWKLWAWKVRNLRHLLRGVPDMAAGRVRPVGRLYVTVIRADGRREAHGLVSTRVVTTAGVNAIADAFQGTFTLSNFKYHAMGTGNTAEATANTALVAEVETRGTGTQTEGASANIYRTVATITATTARAIVEHGIFSASSADTLLDRSVFAAINLSTSDSIQFTYDLTLPAGS
jgi:hypothetical protein